MKIFSVLLLLSTSSLMANALEPEEGATLTSIKTNGSGCPLGSLVPVTVSDKPFDSLQFSEFLAEVGPQMSLSNSRKNCVITANLSAPQGWQYAIGSFEVSGFMGLDQGLIGDLTMTYFFEGQGQTGKITNKITGPYVSDFVYQDQLGLGSLVWSSCTLQRAVNINLSARVGKDPAQPNPAATGFIALDHIAHIGLVWRRCS